uniref:Protein male-specific lethal-2 n=1 Tax=Aceria tosichella TaxID=561515 RepID=A0A6G1SCC1_9ACAR
MLFQFVKLTTSIMEGFKRPDDHAEWMNIFQLMYHMRQALACAICGKIVSNPYTPVQESCHCVCSSCHVENAQMSYNCITCRHAQASQDGFKLNSDLKHNAAGFLLLCKLIEEKGIVQKWPSLSLPNGQGGPQGGTVTFSKLIKEGIDAAKEANDECCLSESFRKAKVKQRRKPCRCGSGKNNNGRPGNLTCLGQRCTCYKEGKGCENCKCVGCKNPNGTSLNEP